MVLLRKVIGDALRARRLSQHRTLREVSTAANVSLGYLSEIERGHKEASSELLASICDALGAPLSEMLGEVSATFALAEQMEEAFAESVAAQRPRELATSVPAGVPAGAGSAGVAAGGADRASSDLVSALAEAELVSDADELAPAHSVVDGDVTVQVHSDGPLRTTLTTRRTADPRSIESLLIG